MKILGRIIDAFPVWILIGSVLALIEPTLFLWFKPYIGLALTVIMLGMGLVLRAEDFKRVLENPLLVGAAALFQYTLMPFYGWALGRLFDLSQPLAVGLIIVACCPGGTASNVICYLARANVALSVSMTAVSTLLAVIATPLLTALLIGDRVEVSIWNLMIGTASVVLVPVIGGILVNRYLPRAARRVAPFSPLAALIAILLVIGSIIGEDREVLLESGFQLLAAVTTLHLLGFGSGYWLAKWLLKDEQASRTVAIEVGMQNSGLGAVLARDNFPALIGVAAPSAITGSVHNIIGSLIVWMCRRYPAR